MHGFLRENMDKQEYALGSTDAEHARLIRQAAGLAPVTERLFREAGVAPGHRVLDLGSGVGDVAMLAARLVGATGEVVGIERDTRSIEIARKRAGKAGLSNVRFLQVDATEVESAQPFDAVVGRFILQFLPDPSGVVRSLTRLVRPGGVVAFHEPCWSPFLSLSADVPLWSAAGAIIYETFLRSGVSADMGAKLHHVFREAGLPAPTMRLEMLLGNDAEYTRWVPDLLSSLVPMARKHGVSLEPLGDLSTLAERTRAEIVAADAVVPWIALVGAWSRKLA
jgi:2-polyprenyl-3-methyl-5-hydroxy-6-metoxy-1,4-benzoquinol methylase